jgi:3-methyladenine DNA glycosylase AlkD
MRNSLIYDLRRTIETAARCNKPEPERRFHKHDEYLSYGLKTPDFREIMKRFRPRVMRLSLRRRLDMAALLLSEHIGELGHAGIHIVALSVDELRSQHLSTLDGLVEDFRSWSHVDHFCGDVMQPLLVRYPKETLALLKEWNHAPIRWKRRASVVTFTRRIARSAGFVDEALELCENLIRDKEDIVLKGVGWALKDNLRWAPERVLPYVKDLRRRGVPSTITLYAIRALKGPERRAILRLKQEA